MIQGSALDLRREAEDAFRTARSQPGALMERVQDGPGAWPPLSADPETAAIAHIAVGRAAAEVPDFPAARRFFSEARAIAATAHLRQWVAEADMGLASILANAGELEAALIQLSEPGLAQGVAAARVESQRALLLQRLGRANEALEAYRLAVAAYRQAGDRAGEARAVMHRGLLHAYANRFDAAHKELRRAARVYRELGDTLMGAYVRHNQGFVAARQGDIPEALRAYEGASRSLARLGVRQPAALIDYCETLLRANLIAEACQVGRLAVEQMDGAGMDVDLAEARLLLAEVVLAAGELAEAEDLALLAVFAFHSQGRAAWAVRARYVWLRVRWASGDRTEATTTAAQTIASDLARAGWASSAAHARILAARMALERGDLALAEAELGVEARHRRRASADVRIQAWHAEALLRWSRGDGPGAESALRAGMKVVASYRAALGATELRANAGHHGAELGRLALQIALHRGEAERVLTWAERSRAATVRLTPVRPPADDELAARLAELRTLNERLDEAARDGNDTAGLVREKAALEDAIRRTTWHAAGFRSAAPPPLSLKGLRRALGDRVLVEFVESDGMLHVVTMRDGRSRLWDLGRISDLENELESLRFSLDRLTSDRGVRGSRNVMEQAFLGSAARLDRMLFGPFCRQVVGRPWVVVPTGPLHVLPWRALPSCHGRPVSVVPSAAVWLEAVSRARPLAGPVVLVAGPNVPQAAGELDALARIYGPGPGPGPAGQGAVRLDGPAATAKAVTTALDGAALAHVAAHGSFRADNPLFSSMRMTDGQLTVYELERLAQAPSCVVLSSCNAGMAAVRPGNELLGLSSAFFALGTSTLVAGVLLVGDDETRRLMVDFHRLLAAGKDAPAALAEAQSLTDTGDVRALASASSFICYGA